MAPEEHHTGMHTHQHTHHTHYVCAHIHTFTPPLKEAYTTVQFSIMISLTNCTIVVSTLYVKHNLLQCPLSDLNRNILKLHGEGFSFFQSYELE